MAGHGNWTTAGLDRPPGYCRQPGIARTGCAVNTIHWLCELPHTRWSAGCAISSTEPLSPPAQIPAANGRLDRCWTSGYDSAPGLILFCPVHWADKDTPRKFVTWLRDKLFANSSAEVTGQGLARHAVNTSLYARLRHPCRRRSCKAVASYYQLYCWRLKN